MSLLRKSYTSSINLFIELQSSIQNGSKAFTDSSLAQLLALGYSGFFCIEMNIALVNYWIKLCPDNSYAETQLLY